MAYIFPNGVIHALPQEIRNEIYGYVLLEYPYIVCGQPFGSTIAKSAESRGGTSNFGILRCCKAISQEALSVFYPSAFFRIYIDIAKPTDSYFLPQAVADRVKNLEIKINMSEWLWSRPMTPAKFDEARSISHDIVEKFCNARVSRNSCRILFWSCNKNLDHFDHEILHIPLIGHLQRLHSFKRLIIDVESTHWSTETLNDM